jgi:uncharacterized membrane protein
VGRTEVTELLEYYFSFVLLPSSWFSKPHLHKAVTVGCYAKKTIKLLTFINTLKLFY